MTMAAMHQAGSHDAVNVQPRRSRSAKASGEQVVMAFEEPEAQDIRDDGPQSTPGKQAAQFTATGSLIVRDEQGHQLRLGLMQQLIVDYLHAASRTLEEVAGRIKEPAERARTRLRKLAARGVTVLGDDGRWSLKGGPAVPAEPPPHARRSRAAQHS